MIVFNIAINNSDDHLRNHGFILTKKGWELSPAYDLTLSPFGSSLKLNITENDNTADFDLALETAPFYGIGFTEAKQLIDDIKKKGSQWQKKTYPSDSHRQNKNLCHQHLSGVAEIFAHSVVFTYNGSNLASVFGKNSGKDQFLMPKKIAKVLIFLA